VIRRAAARIAELLMWTAENRGRYNRDNLRYPSDLTDAEWIEITPLIAPTRSGGRRPEVDVRNLVNGVTNVLTPGCQRRYIPRIRTNAGIVARLGSIVHISCAAGNPTRSLETAPPPCSEA
jgi:hypothetical protein